jgi:hypothetical protein
MEDVDGVRTGSTWELSVLVVQFSCAHRTALKNSLLKLIDININKKGSLNPSKILENIHKL